MFYDVPMSISAVSCDHPGNRLTAKQVQANLALTLHDFSFAITIYIHGAVTSGSTDTVTTFGQLGRWVGLRLLLGDFSQASQLTKRLY